MANRLPPARDVARWTGRAVWIDHAAVTVSDLEWLTPARSLIVWAVRGVADVVGRMPDLEWLDLRGGSGESADFIAGCRALRYLQVNQVRGLSDLSALADAPSLEYLSLYGLPRVRALPSLHRLHQLRRADIGSMKGLTGLTGLLDAPNLEELLLVRKVGLAPTDPRSLANHPALRAFGWLAEDVPDRTWEPVVETVARPEPEQLSPEEWFGLTG